MTVRVTSKRQVTFPAKVLDLLGVGPGDMLDIQPAANGTFVLRARRIDESKLAPLKGRLPKGVGTFDLETFRSQPYDASLRD